MLRHSFLFFKFSGELKMADWEDVIITVAKVLDSTPGDRMAALVGGMADAETLVALKDLFNRLGCEDLCTESSFPMDYGGKSKLSFGSIFAQNFTLCYKKLKLDFFLLLR